MLNGLCWDDSYTIAQWSEHRWPEGKVPGSIPGGNGTFFFRHFPFSIPSTYEYQNEKCKIMAFRTFNLSALSTIALLTER